MQLTKKKKDEQSSWRFVGKRTVCSVCFLSLQVFDENDVRRMRFVGRQKEVTLRIVFRFYNDYDVSYGVVKS